MNDKCIELIAETVAEKNEWFAALKKCLVGEVQRSNSDFPHRNGSSVCVILLFSILFLFFFFKNFSI